MAGIYNMVVKNMDRELAKKFKVHCVLEGKSMTGKLKEMIKKEISKKGTGTKK